MILKEGAVVDRDALPVKRILTKPVEPPSRKRHRTFPLRWVVARFPRPHAHSMEGEF